MWVRGMKDGDIDDLDPDAEAAGMIFGETILRIRAYLEAKANAGRR